MKKSVGKPFVKALEEAIYKAIEEVGFENLKKLSWFPSNRK